MGIVMCSVHGRRAMVFSSPLIANEIARRSGAVTEDIYAMRLWWCEMWWLCLIDREFLAANALSTSSAVIVIEDEDRSDGLMGKLAPVCHGCFWEYVNSRESLRALLAAEAPGDGRSDV